MCVKKKAEKCQNAGKLPKGNSVICYARAQKSASDEPPASWATCDGQNEGDIVVCDNEGTWSGNDACGDYGDSEPQCCKE